MCDRMRQEDVFCVVTVIGQFWLFLTLFSAIPPSSDACKHPIIGTKLYYKFNSYHNAWIIVTNPKAKASTVFEAVDKLRKKNINGILVKAPFGIDLSKQLEVYHASETGIIWKTKESTILPAVKTTMAGAQIIIVDKDKNVLVIEDKGRKGKLGFPCGGGDEKELPRDTALREVEEEIGMSLDPNSLKLVAVANRIQEKEKTGYDRVMTGYYYVAPIKQKGSSVKLRLQESEIAQAFWVPLQQLLTARTICGLEVPGLYQKILNEVFGSQSARKRFEKQPGLAVEIIPLSLNALH